MSTAVDFNKLKGKWKQSYDGGIVYIAILPGGKFLWRGKSSKPDDPWSNLAFGNQETESTVRVHWADDPTSVRQLRGVMTLKIVNENRMEKVSNIEGSYGGTLWEREP